MPSPLAHTAMGYVIYRFSRRNLSSERQRIFLFPVLLILTVFLSLAPDLDSIPGLVLGDFGSFHNNGTHSLVLGLVVSLVVAAIARLRKKNFWRWFVVALACYGLHIVLDFFTEGRGVMLFWPFTDERFSSPVKLFFGFHWSEGLFSVLHLWTFANEMIFVALVLLGVHWVEKLTRRGFQPGERKESVSEGQAEEI